MGSPGPGVVIVGTGFGVLTHLRAARAAGLDVVALVGRDQAKASERAALFGVPHATTDLDAALVLSGVDTDAVATPPHTHVAIALAAIAAGKHVVCEKPFARDVAEARTMLSAAERAGVIHLLGTEFRFGPAQALLARLVSEGTIGTPQHALFELQLPTHADPAAELPDWWQLRSEGGGWLGAHGSHVIDQVRSTLGEITGVSASLQRLADRPAMTADDTYSAHLRLANGATVWIHGSCAARGQFVMTTKVVGADGAAWLQGADVWLDTGTGPAAVPIPDDLAVGAPEPPPASLIRDAYDAWHSMGIDLGPYTRLYEVLRDRMAGEPVPADPAPATFADGVACQAVMDAIHASSDAGGQWVPIEPEG
jgi:predicted dehydrogenase